jgi:hypothetical protein
MPRQLNPLMMSQFKVTCSRLPDTYFTKFSGIEETRTVTTYSDGYSQVKQRRVGASELSNITLSKPFDVETDAPLLRLLQGYCEGGDGATFDITVTPVRICNNVERKGSLVFTALGCRPVRYKLLEVDADSTEGISMLEMELTVSSVRF